MDPNSAIAKYQESHSMRPLILSRVSVTYTHMPFGSSRKLSDPEPYHGDTGDVYSIVVYFLQHCHQRSTLYAHNRRYQCHRGARRSATDLYRLALTINPEIKLADVMRELHKMANSRVCNELFCSTVLKRVFWFGDGKPMEDGVTNTGDFRRDEYGLKFSDWENIGHAE